MRQTAPRTQPPSIAAWLVELFASADHAENLLGDLTEEFSDIALKLGVASARRWYWRQSMKTIAHLSGAAFRTERWSLVGVVTLGFLLHWLFVALPAQVIVAILHAQRPYSNLHYDLYVWLVTWGIPIERIVEMTLVGCFVAMVAKGREIIATIALIAILAGILGLNLFVHNRDLPPPMRIPWTRLLGNFPNWLATLLGGILTRTIRSVLPRQLSKP